MMSTTEGELDVEVLHEREDGELEDSDVEEGTYIPLARPEAFNPPSLVHMQIQDEQSDEGSAQDSSGSESDDEPRRRAKRTKIRPRRPQPQPNKKDKYNIWCKALEEDLLTEDMVSCDVTKKSRYGVESYDYTIKYRLDDNYIPKNVFKAKEEYSDSEQHEQQLSNKRRHADRSDESKSRQRKRINSYARNSKLKPRFLSDLTANADSTADVIAKEISENLSEDKKDLVEHIIQIVGAEKAIEIYKETQRVEADGGLLIINGTRRRTSGGLYFYLLKNDPDVTQEMVSQMFSEDRRETHRQIKRARASCRQKVMEQLKQSLTDSELPSLLSRGEAAAASEPGSNPPPSPATDARDGSSDTDHAPAPPPHTDLDDDDFLEVMCNDDMDLF
ncbi:unnamed protein product [Chrysodeixis includens]|uniref:Phosphorylated adapter RNA export protein n=1 Tax=Chrysodeixis includens TaxID=689277 RepID=A0A9P0BKG3_CHRIL|nr:unnamed protein product [Chrysodeixis includens]